MGHCPTRGGGRGRAPLHTRWQDGVSHPGRYGTLPGRNNDFQRKGRVLHPLNHSAALREQHWELTWGVESQACITEMWPPHKGSLGWGAIRRGGPPSPTIQPPYPCPPLGLLDPSFQLFSSCQRDLSQFSINFIWNRDVTQLPLSLRDLDLRPASLINLENLKLILKFWLFPRDFYSISFVLNSSFPT